MDGNRGQGKFYNNRRGRVGGGGRFRPYARRGRGYGQGNRSAEAPEDSFMMPPPVASGRARSSVWRPGGEGGYRGSRGYGGNPGRRSPDPDDDDPEDRSYLRRPLVQPTIDSTVLAQFEKQYPGYRLYFARTLPTIPNLVQKVDVVKDYLCRHNFVPSKAVADDFEEKEYYDVKYERVLEDPVFLQQWPTFATDLVGKPQDVLNIWGLAMHTVVFDVLTQTELEIASQEEEAGMNLKKKTVNVPYIQARLMKVEPVTPLKALKSSLLGKFVTIRGAVVRTGNVRPQCTHMTFSCSSCLAHFAIEQPEGRFTFPVRCLIEDCDGKQFDTVESARTTKLVDSRKIRLQDIQHSDGERGAVPRTIDCELFGNLVKVCNAGDAVTLCGIVKMNRDTTGGQGGDQSLHNLYLEVIAVRNHKDSERTMGGNWFSFTNKDYYAVKEIHDTENLFRLLVASICPTIYGHDLVKAGLLLCLFGGTPASANATVSRRSDINVLIVGDPGLGKSQMLGVVSEVAPRGVYVCGTASTVAGLTVTLVKEGDEYSLEAGALVMADRGVCCIDEFDKMQAQHHALLEAMEQQSISIAKSGVFRTLPARTSVIAAANPVGGHYDKTKTVAENIRISPALLSRFDLTFILLDRSDEEMDKNIVNHIMGIRRADNTDAPIPTSCSQVRPAAENESADLPLKERLKFEPNEEVDIISHHLIRKYIAYARQYVKPVLSKEAAAVIKEYYLKLRVTHRTVDSTPVTTRQLESLLRLTQARAKVELRVIATEQDAKDVLEIFEFGMSGVFENDLIVSSTLSQMSVVFGSTSGKSYTKNKAKKLVSALQGVAERQSKNIFHMDEIKQLGRALGLGDGVEGLVSSLNNEGFLLSKGGRVYQLQSADF